MNKTVYNLNISSANQGPTGDVMVNTSIQTDSTEELSRLLKLSGIIDVEVVEVCPKCGKTECDCGDVEEVCSNCMGTGYDQANNTECMECAGSTAELEEMYDYGHSMTRLARYENAADLKPINPKQQFGKPGDNTMEDTAEEILEKLTEAYTAHLLEDIDPSSGMSSPLTATVRDEFDKDPLANEEVDESGNRSPLSRVKRQPRYR
jgi:hypothetical protein